MGASQSQGPKTPTGVPGSVLQKQLQKEGATFRDGLELIKHVIDHKTPGYVTHIKWNKEHSTLQHEYLLFCIAFQDNCELSWVRFERMGDIRNKMSDSERKPAGFLFTPAPSPKTLFNWRDTTIENTNFEPSVLELIDVAYIISIIHEDVADYTLFHHNCWWFARQLFKILISNFMPDNKQKKKILSSCSKRTVDQAMAPFHSRWRGRLLRGGIYLITFPVFPIFWPIFIGGTIVMGVYALKVLDATEERLNARVAEYLKNRTVSEASRRVG